MQETGCGCQRAASSTSTTGSTVPLPLARRLTKTETTSGENPFSAWKTRIFEFLTDRSISWLFAYRKYIPQLCKYPAEYIYEPWKAPKSVQQAAGCVIGKDYPSPIVEHDKVYIIYDFIWLREMPKKTTYKLMCSTSLIMYSAQVREINIKRMDAAYKANKLLAENGMFLLI